MHRVFHLNISLCRTDVFTDPPYYHNVISRKVSVQKGVIKNYRKKVKWKHAACEFPSV